MHTYQVLDITVHEVRMISEAYGKNLAKQLPWQTTVYVSQGSPTKDHPLC